MRGVFKGLRLTMSHLTRPKVTQLYPYEKPRLPGRSRGLIQLIQEDNQDTPFNLKCEACLLCEKVCPPRAISIEYRPTHRFRKRPYFSQQSRANFYTPRISEYAANYHNRPQASVLKTPTKVELEADSNLQIVDDILAKASFNAYDLTDILDQVMQAYGGLPLKAAHRIVEARGIDLSDLYGVATALPSFKPFAARTSDDLRNDQVVRGPSAATRGKNGEINHRRGFNA